jgi:hypothetical protein
LGWRRDDDVPSASALCQARRKLDATRCAAVSSQVYDLCTTARACASLGYAGMRLLAEDGTKLALPAYAVLQRHFGCPTQGEGRELSGPQAALTVLWDVGAQQPVTWRVGPYKDSEQAHASDMVGSLGPGDLLLCDRNFPSRRYLTQIHQRKADALMRMRTTGVGVMHEVAAFIASGASDALVDIETRDEHDRQIDALPTIRVRLLRVQTLDGVTVYLTSLLDQRRHPAQGLIDLYAQRWRIETAFREMKVWHGLERFHARHVDGIAQEIAAVMIFLLLASELEAQARLAHQPAQVAQTTADDREPHTVQRPAVRFNRRIVADCAIRLLYAAAKGSGIDDTFRYALFRIWRYRQTPRDGRSFPRKRKSAPRGWKPRGTMGKGRP